MKAKLPPKYSGDRFKRTAQHAAAQQHKMVQQKTKEVSDAVLTAMQAGQAPTTPFMTQGPAAEPRAAIKCTSRRLLWHHWTGAVPKVQEQPLLLQCQSWSQSGSRVPPIKAAAVEFARAYI